MEMKLAALLLALLLAPLCHAVPDSTPQGVENWFKRLPVARKKLTKLHFFIHDIMTGDHPTTVPIAQANITATSPTKFGLTFVMDSPLTAGPEIDSELIGRCQGVFYFASQKEIGLLLTLNFYFTAGKYNGSTLSVLSNKRNGDTFREYVIVGGSGVFRLAEGITSDHTYTGPLAPGTKAPTEAQVMVLHYDDAGSEYAEDIKFDVKTPEYAEEIDISGSENIKYSII